MPIISLCGGEMWQKVKGVGSHARASLTQASRQIQLMYKWQIKRGEENCSQPYS